jgi:RNA polymerase sigma-70 factor, ECF subfamily
VTRCSRRPSNHGAAYSTRPDLVAFERDKCDFVVQDRSSEPVRKNAGVGYEIRTSWRPGAYPESPLPFHMPRDNWRSRDRHRVMTSSPNLPRQPHDAGQADLLRRAHDAHGPALLRYVLRLTRGDREFAEDVVQESLLRLWQNPTILQAGSDESARAWLHTVARNLVIDDRRSSRYKRELKTESLPERQAPDALGPAVDSWVVTEALRSLSPEHRAVVVRAHYLGQTAAEIARHEEIPQGTVKSRLHYALRAMRLALEERGVA